MSKAQEAKQAPKKSTRKRTSAAKQPTVKIKVKKLNNDAQLPKKAYPESAGFDITASVKTIVSGLSTAAIPTGLAMEIPEGYFVQIKDRSGLALDEKTFVKAGTIDSDYRGEVKIILGNAGDFPVTIEKGQRVAQFTVEKVTDAEIVEVDKLSETKRGEGGLGSTGK